MVKNYPELRGGFLIIEQSISNLLNRVSGKGLKINLGHFLVYANGGEESASFTFELFRRNAGSASLPLSASRFKDFPPTPE